MRRPQRKTKVLLEMIRLLHTIGRRRPPKNSGSKLTPKGRLPSEKSRAPLITWVAARTNPQEYFPPALHDMAAYLLWINAVFRNVNTPH